jgi:hypothetical protein
MAISLIGQLKSSHPFRMSIVEKIKDCGLPFLVSESLQEQAPSIYENFLININVSLNNDFNMRFVEVISAGGFLLTDRISKYTGYSDVFTEGEDFVFYENEEDLLEKIHYYFKNPDKAIKIAKSGWQKFVSTWSIKMRREKFANLIDHKLSDNFPDFKDERFCEPDKSLLTIIEFRKALYGFMQEMNKTGRCRVYLPEFIYKAIMNDVADLCRLEFLTYNLAIDFSSMPAIFQKRDLPEVLVIQKDTLLILSHESTFLSRFKQVIHI